MVLHAAAIFLGAFLLFLVQPIVAKMLLPRFGGSVAVWATCLVFFQAALLAGYALAHELVRRGSPPTLRLAHGALLLASVALLPIVPGGSPWSDAAPALQILTLLSLTIGLPYAMLAMTSPLLQAWIARGAPARNPYRLFAVSNAASLAALLAYPWLIEPWLPTATQARAWSVAYAAYVLLLCAISLQLAAVPGEPRAASTRAALPASRWFGWAVLAALGSYELVAVTNHLTQNIPSFPMMWVLPLVLYLASFTLAFDADRWYRSGVYRSATLAAIGLACALLLAERELSSIFWPIAGFLAVLFVVCMFCHGELARSRPAPSQLTGFYLAVSAGGVVGGAAVALAAPMLLRGYFEVEIGLVLAALAVAWRVWPAGARWRAAAVLALLASIGAAMWRVHAALNEVIAIERNFYGVLRVREYGRGDPREAPERVLIHGRVLHGQQYLAPDRQRRPTAYYTGTSGIGRLLQALSDRQVAVGAVGLGAGTIATYGQPGDNYRFYEIDPAVVDAAHRYFSFLGDSAATVEVVVGDGRLALQADTGRRFDVLVVDAFSGDSIPVHLLTLQAVQLYLQRLAADGVVALHVSNSHLDLRPVVAGVATALGLEAAYVADPSGGAEDPSRSASDWVLLARDRRVLDLPPIRAVATPLPAAGPVRVWTDDYSNIIQLLSLRWTRRAD